MQDAELFAPLAYPMYIEPNDWTNDKKGGYLLNEVIRGHHFIIKGEVGIVQGELVLRFLNKFQTIVFFFEFQGTYHLKIYHQVLKLILVLSLY